MMSLPVGRDDVMFATNIGEADIISEGNIISESCIICRRQTSMKKAFRPKDKRLFLAEKEGFEPSMGY